MTEKFQVPNFEATAERKKIYTLKQWLERVRQYTKRKRKVDIAEVVRGAELARSGWQKQIEIERDFIWGIETDALYHMTRAEYKTEPDKIAIKDLIRLFKEYFLAKRNAYQNRGEFLRSKQTGTETPKNFGQRLREIGEEFSFESITAEELLILQFMAAITDKKRRNKLMKKKTLKRRKLLK